MIGSMCSRPNRIGAVIASSPRGAVPSPAAARSISSKSASTRLAPARKRSPTSVRLTARVVRLSRRTPRRASSSATARVTALGEWPRRRAAAAKPPCSATATKIVALSIRSILLLILVQPILISIY